MPKQNYHQARKQKELARKARQQEKQQRRVTARQSAPDVAAEANSSGAALAEGSIAGEVK